MNNLMTILISITQVVASLLIFIFFTHIKKLTKKLDYKFKRNLLFLYSLKVKYSIDNMGHGGIYFN